MATSTLSPRDKFAAARLLVREKAPYVQAALFGLVVKEAPGLGTFGVTANGILMIDYEAVRPWSVEETAAALFHEVWHVLRDHHGRGQACGANPTLFNYAGDAEINDDLREGGWAVGDDWVFPENLECEEGLTAEEYYAHVRSNMKCAKCKKPVDPKDIENKQQQARDKADNQDSPDGDEKDDSKGNSAGQDDGDEGAGQDGVDSGSSSNADSDDDSDGSESSSGDSDGGEQDSSASQPGSSKQNGSASSTNGTGTCQCAGEPGRAGKPGPGWCGSAAGNPLPGEPKNGDKSENGEVKGRSDADIRRMRREVARSAQEHSESSKGRGTVPGGILRWAGEHLKPPRIRWQDKLARFTRSAVAYRAGAVDYKYSRPSRRQYGVGFGFGKPILPCMQQPVPTVLVAVDTSGSMGTDELTTALQETNGVLQQTGAKVNFMSCDAAVHAVGEVRTWKDMLPLLKGGGGTSFCPVFEALPQVKPRPDVVIFVTDGCGDAPVEAPPGIKVIWLLVGPHKTKPYFGGYGDRGNAGWGDFIFMEDEIIEELEQAA